MIGIFIIEAHIKGGKGMSEITTMLLQMQSTALNGGIEMNFMEDTVYRVSFKKSGNPVIVLSMPINSSFWDIMNNVTYIIHMIVIEKFKDMPIFGMKGNSQIEFYNSTEVGE